MTTAQEKYQAIKAAIDELQETEDEAVVYDLLEELSSDINAKIYNILYA